MNNRATKIPTAQPPESSLFFWTEESSMEMRKLFIVPLRLIASPDYMATRKRPLRPADLASWRWIRFEPRPRTVELSHPKHGVKNALADSDEVPGKASRTKKGAWFKSITCCSAITGT
jgi:DNA-binding transcriptional LysR family regulator